MYHHVNQRGMITNTNYQHLLEDVEKSLGLVRSSADTEVTSLITDHDAVSLPVPSRRSSAETENPQTVSKR